MKCHRCGVELTLTIAGDDYCRRCKAEVKAREEQDAKRVLRSSRFRTAKDLSGSAA